MMIRYLAKIVTKLFHQPLGTVSDFCPWCFDPMSKHVGGVECQDALQVDCAETLDVRQQTKDGREMGERDTGRYPIAKKATGLYQAARPWDPYPEHTEGD